MASWIDAQELPLVEGGLFTCRQWEVDLYRRFESGADQIPVTLPRGNGKSHGAAALCYALLEGPDALPDTEIKISSPSLVQSKIVARITERWLRLKCSDYEKRFRRLDHMGAFRILNIKTGTRLRAYAAASRRLHGSVNARAWVVDEPSQMSNRDCEGLFSAIRGSRGKGIKTQVIVIGTRPSSRDHPFSRMLSNQRLAPIVYWSPPELDWRLRSTWETANPGLSENAELLRVIAEECQDAQADPGLQRSFESYRLNRGSSDLKDEPLFTASAWLRVEQDLPEPTEAPAVIGLDLGGSVSMTAATGVWADGSIRTLAAFPELPDLAQREARDNVAGVYQNAHLAGELLLHGSRITDVSAFLEDVFARWGSPEVLLSDRYRKSETQDVLNALSMPPETIYRGLGFRDGSEDLRRTRKAVISGAVQIQTSRLLRHSIAGTRVIRDAAGNAKPVKVNDTSRIDLVVSLLLASGEWSRRQSEPAFYLPPAVRASRAVH